jgi:hypothetical protein
MEKEVNKMKNNIMMYVFGVVLLIALVAFGFGAVHIGNFELVNTIAVALIAALSAATAYFFGKKEIEDENNNDEE